MFAPAAVVSARISKAVRVGMIAASDRLRPLQTPPVLVDIGARGGLQNKWRLYAAVAPLTVVFVEPDQAEARRLEQEHRARVLPVALGDQPGRRTLHLTADPGCASLLPPAEPALRSPIGWRLQPAGSIEIDVVRADAALAALPAPDFLKIDTQGTELEILRGFGALLGGVCAIELECELLEIYRGQPLLTDVVRYLHEAGFGLAALRPRGMIDGGIWDADTFFVRRPSLLTQRQQRLVRTWQRVNGLPSGFDYQIAG